MFSSRQQETLSELKELVRIFKLIINHEANFISSLARSPIFAQTTASLEGLTTIRAFAAETQLKKEFSAALDSNTSAFFLFVATSRGFV